MPLLSLANITLSSARPLRSTPSFLHSPRVLLSFSVMCPATFLLYSRHVSIAPHEPGSPSAVLFFLMRGALRALEAVVPIPWRGGAPGGFATQARLHQAEQRPQERQGREKESGARSATLRNSEVSEGSPTIACPCSGRALLPFCASLEGPCFRR